MPDPVETSETAPDKKAPPDAENVIRLASAPDPTAAASEDAQPAAAAAGGPPDPAADRIQISGPVDRTILERLAQGLCDQAEQNRVYYDGKARKAGAMSRRLRVWAVILGVAGGLCPLMPVSLLEKIVGEPAAAAVSSFGFVFFALAAAAVLLDQAFGYSSSWMRSRLAELELARLVSAFRIEVVSALACGPERVAADDARRTLARVAAFADDINGAALRETQAWVAEFKAGLLQIEHIARSSAKNKSDADGG